MTEKSWIKPEELKENQKAFIMRGVNQPRYVGNVMLRSNGTLVMIEGEVQTSEESLDMRYSSMARLEVCDE